VEYHSVAEFWGVAAIAKRLGVSPPTVQRLHMTAGLLIYRRTLKRSTKGHQRWAWYTSDELIRLWEVARCKADLEWARARRTGRPYSVERSIDVREGASAADEAPRMAREEHERRLT
jgi:hypothetical protein